MSLSEFISGRNKKSKLFISYIHPLKPEMNNFKKIEFLGSDLKIANNSSKKVGALLNKVFSEAARLVIARKEGNKYFEIIKELRAKVGLNFLSKAGYYTQNLIVEYSAAKEAYKRYLFNEINIDEVLPFCFFIAKFDLIGSYGFSPENYRDIIAPPSEEQVDQIKKMILLFERYLENRFPGGVPGDKVFCPTFGDISRAIGGASSDIYMNETLTLFSLSSKNTLSSILKYKVASLIVMDSMKNFEFNSGNLQNKNVRYISIYFARYSCEYILDISKFLKNKKIENSRAIDGLLRNFCSTKISKNLLEDIM